MHLGGGKTLRTGPDRNVEVREEKVESRRAHAALAGAPARRLAERRTCCRFDGALRNLLGAPPPARPLPVPGKLQGIGEPRMRKAAVVALERVLDDDLPVRLHLEAHFVGGAVLGDAGEIHARVDILEDVFEVAMERLDLPVAAHEDEGTPGLDPQLPKSNPFRYLPYPGRLVQRPVQPVGPGVIGATQLGCHPRARGDFRAPVPAHVVESAAALSVVYDENAVSTDTRHRVRAGPIDFAHEAGESPGTAKEVLPFLRESIRIAVRPRRDAGGCNPAGPHHPSRQMM